LKANFVLFKMAYTKKPQIKTNAEWDKINFKNNLGPQIGGILHDSVAIVVAEINNSTAETEKWSAERVEKDIKYWLDILYKLAEAKKEDLLEIKPVTHEQAERANKAFAQKKSIREIEEEENEANKLEEISNQVATEEEPEYTGEQVAERSYEEEMDKQYKHQD
jgi:hypothetical protein